MDRLKNYKTLAYPEIDRERGFDEIVNSPIYKDYVISKDGKTSGIVVYLKEDERLREFIKSLNIEIPSKERCNGIWNRCSYCGGTGVIRQQQGFFSMQQTCPHCRGEGEIHDPNCSICNGVGYINKNKKLSVKIPAGVDDGDRIRLSGEGELGRGGNRGDLYISINVKEHSIFERDGRHLYCEVPLDFVDAALGGSIEVPTLSGKAKIKIPSGTQLSLIHI